MKRSYITSVVLRLLSVQIHVVALWLCDYSVTHINVKPGWYSDR